MILSEETVGGQERVTTDEESVGTARWLNRNKFVRYITIYYYYILYIQQTYWHTYYLQQSSSL